MQTEHLQCMNGECPNPSAAQQLLSDNETEHIVRFNERGFFNVKHPLRERIDGELLDCPIHAVVTARVHSEGTKASVAGSTWRVTYEPIWLENPEFGGDPFSWEQL
jgi:hypothetical protein